ncbi:helix-turn-helix transcriptional regulator [bacterium]|nr:helix-turn-helix transcriptional regulator [bacterium]
MHKQDTATLNQEALLARMRESDTRQARLAVAINVTPLTVNRWMTGKVKRISRDNLARLAAALNCDPDSLIIVDETDVLATENEQSAAARLLVQRDNQELFIKSGQLENYERLIKAVVHPRLPLSDLADIYSSLTFAAAKQGKLQELRRYAGLKLEYAQRLGDGARELAARTHLVLVDAEEGKLLKARRGLLDLLSSAESQGLRKGTSIPIINLIQVYRLMGDAKRAFVYAIRVIEYLTDVPDTDWPRAYACGNAAMAASDAGLFELAATLKRAEAQLSRVQSPHERTEFALFLLAMRSLGGEAVGISEIEPLAAQYLGAVRFNDGHAEWPALLYRRCGALAETGAYLDQLENHSACCVYEAPFIARERARLLSAQGQAAAARAALEEANSGFIRLAMKKRVESDPAAEQGSQQRIPAALAQRVAALLPALLSSSG